MIEIFVPCEAKCRLKVDLIGVFSSQRGILTRMKEEWVFDLAQGIEPYFYPSWLDSRASPSLIKSQDLR